MKQFVSLVLACVFGLLLAQFESLRWNFGNNDVLALVITLSLILLPIIVLTYVSQKLFPRAFMLWPFFVPIYWIVSQPLVIISVILLSRQPWEGKINDEVALGTMLISSVLGGLIYLAPIWLIKLAFSYGNLRSS